MKIFSIVSIIAFLAAATLCRAQTTGNAQTQQTTVPPPTPYAVVSQGANSKVWEWTTYEALPSGQVVPHLHHYTELATGLSYQQNGQWVDSQEQINIQPDGTASATAGQHQAYFPSDIGNGTITLVTPDGLQLQSQPLGLFYDDGSNTVMLAELTNSVGQLISPNQIIYTNAFTGLDADLLYTYTKAGFEQDVILNEQPQSPEYYGLNPQTAQLQMLTEFFNPPQPAVTTVQLPEQAGLALSDDTLGFGTMKMVPGRAFLLGTNADDGQVMVGKQWLLVGGRQFLAESVPVAAIANQLAQMPAVQISSISSKTPLNIVSAKRLLPSHRLARRINAHQERIAEGEIPIRGLLLDYQTVNTSETNVTFRADTTYYISGTVDLFGTNTFEGGTVVKYAANGSIYQNGGNIDWNANAYNPVIFTAKDDDTIGQQITGSTGNPTNYYANPALGISSMTSTQSISNIRVSWAALAININYSDLVSLYNGQLVNCQQGIIAGYNSLDLRNMLFANVQTNFSFAFEQFDAENVTFNNSSWLIDLLETGSASFENCIFANVAILTNNIYYYSAYSTFSGSTNGFYNSPEFGAGTVTNNFYPFRSAGEGYYYLTNGCAFTNGTTSIDTNLLADLMQKTTYPPVLFSNTTIPYVTNFMPQAQRDDNGLTVDLGYHYDPIDYMFGNVQADTNLSFSAGTVMGFFAKPNYGIALPNYAVVTFNGTAMSPCVEAHYNTVQEGGNNSWLDNTSVGGIVAYGSVSGISSTVNAQFTHFAGFANGENYVRDDTSDLIFNAKDCEFWSGDEGGYGIHDEFTNCLINGLPIGVQANSSVYSSLVMENCTMREGYILTAHWDGAIWPVWIQNSAYEGTDMSQMDDTSPSGTDIYCNYNSFLTSTNQLIDEGANTVVVANGYNWESSWFGNYYLPTNSPLIGKGNTNASDLGLYEFTTQTNQTIEGTNKVDIGYHYVATDTNGNPLDTYVSGTPNYIVDSQGNGMDTNGLPYWWEGEYFGEVGLNPNSDPDASGHSLIYDYTNGINPTPFPLTIVWPQNGTPVSGSNFTLQAQAGGPSVTVVASIVDTNGDTNIVQGLVEQSGAVWAQNLPLAAGTNVLTVTATDTLGNQTTTNLTVTQSSVTVTMNPLSSDQLNQQLVNVGGTVSDPTSSVFVNGIEATNNDGIWAATNVPVSPTDIAVLNVNVYTGDPVLETSQNYTQPQPPTVVLSSFSALAYLFVSNEDDQGPFYCQEADSWTWNNGAQFGQFSFTEDWIDNIYGEYGGASDMPPDGPGFAAPWFGDNQSYLTPVWEQSAITYDDGNNFEQRTNQMTVMLVPGGGQMAGTVGTYLILAHASEFSVPPFINPNENFFASSNFWNFLFCFAPPSWYAGDVPLPPQWLQINGQQLVNTGVTNDDGSIWGAMTTNVLAGDPVDVTVNATEVHSNNDYTFDENAYQLVSQCVATTPVNQARTNIGVGEQVNLFFNPALPANFTNITWSATAGGLSVTTGVTNLFTAPSNAAIATVTANVSGILISNTFNVFEPTGFAYALNEGTISYPVNQNGAGMYNNVWIGPTNVSFYRVQVEEVGGPASDITGYWASTNYSYDLTHNPTSWAIASQTLSQNNLWGTDEAADPGNPPPWSNGTFQWDIPVGWRIVGTVPTNYMQGWTQYFTIYPDGTESIEKFGFMVTRTTNNVSIVGTGR